MSLSQGPDIFFFDQKDSEDMYGPDSFDIDFFLETSQVSPKETFDFNRGEFNSTQPQASITAQP